MLRRSVAVIARMPAAASGPGIFTPLLTATALLVTFGASATARESGPSRCKPAKNIAVVIDDSGSMRISDRERLRSAAIELLSSKPGNGAKTMSAVEFGTGSRTLFEPARIDEQRPLIKKVLERRIKADEGSTNYNAGFGRAQIDNPRADALIFLTDGRHNVGTYADAHREGPKTYVVGFGDSFTERGGAVPNPRPRIRPRLRGFRPQAHEGPAERLARIAEETGGRYYPQTDSTTLQMVVNEIDAILSCSTPPKTFIDQFASVGEAKSHRVRLRKGARSLDIVTSWVGRDNKFKVVALSYSKKRRARAASANPLALARGAPGDTYGTMKVRARRRRGRGPGGGPRPGTKPEPGGGTRTVTLRGSIRFRVVARQLGRRVSQSSPVTVVTQVSQNRRRR